MATQSKPQQLTPFGYALAGALGGCFSNAVVYPLDTIKTRIQAATDEEEERTGEPSDLSMHHLLLRIVQEEGIAGLYNGFGATMLNTFSMQYAYFFFYSLVRTSYIKRVSAKLPPKSPIPALSTAAELTLGALAGALAQIFTIPVSVIATRQQIHHRHRHARAVAAADAAASSSSSGTTSDAPSSVGADKGEAPSYASVAEKGDVSQATPTPNPVTPTPSSDQEDEDDNSFLGVARRIIKEDGVTGLWLGMGPSLVLTVNPAITYGVYERVKGIMVLAQEKAGQGTKLGPWTSFLLGAISKTLATVVTYPYIMAKVRIQAGAVPYDDSNLEKSDKTKDASLLPQHATPAASAAKLHHLHKHASALNILHHVFRTHGFLGLYQGMRAQITKAVISQALLFVSREKFEHWALAIMVLVWRLRGGGKA